MGLWIIFGVFFLLSLIAGGTLKRRFKKYSRISLENGMSGAEVAKKMLDENGCHDVKVISVKGQLSDHYNPSTKTVNLSQDVYNGRNIAAAAVAAHEVGHAVQHANAYTWLKLRSALVPVQNVSATILNVIFIGMFIGAYALESIFSFELALQIIIACYAAFTIFAFITLPVEFDASKRALIWLKGSGVASLNTLDKAKDALRWAASTYVIAAISSLATLLYYVSLLAGIDD